MSAAHPTPICRIAPQNVGIVRTFTAIPCIGLAATLLTGRTSFRRVIDRDEEPVHYWKSVACIGLLALSSLVGLMVCPGD